MKVEKVENLLENFIRAQVKSAGAKGVVLGFGQRFGLCRIRSTFNFLKKAMPTNNTIY